jgi:hypothetical protein
MKFPILFAAGGIAGSGKIYKETLLCHLVLIHVNMLKALLQISLLTFNLQSPKILLHITAITPKV